MSKTNKEVAGTTTLRSPVQVVFLDNLEERDIGDILVVGKVYYKLDRNGLWWETKEAVHPHEIRWEFEQTVSITEVEPPVVFLDISFKDLKEKDIKSLSVMWPTAKHDGEGNFSVPVNGIRSQEERNTSLHNLYNGACDRLGIPRPDIKKDPVGVFKFPAGRSIGNIVDFLCVTEYITHQAQFVYTKDGWVESGRKVYSTLALPVPMRTPSVKVPIGIKEVIEGMEFIYTGNNAWMSTGVVNIVDALPVVQTHAPMPPVKAAKPEQGEVTYSANAPDKSMEFRMGGATIAQIENVQRIFPSLEHRGDGYFVLTLPNLGAVGDYPDPAVREQYASVIYKGVCDIMNNTAPGYVPPQQPVVTEERPIRPLDHFLTDPMNIPPRRGSNEDRRRGNIRAALTSAADMTVPELVNALKRHAEQLDPTAEGAREDAGILALAVLQKNETKRKKRKARRITLGVAVAALLVAVGFTGTEFVKKNLVSSNYTTINECKVPFGDTELEGKRFRTYTYKSLLGYRFGGNDDISVERLEVKLPGSDITILGRDLDKDKPWRLTYAKGEYGTALLKPSEQYWFVGNGDRTTLVNNTEFCH